MGDSDHSFQLEAFGIFKTAWLSLQHDPRQCSPAATDEVIEQASDKLVAATLTKEATEAGSFFYSTLSAIMDYGNESPASLDLMLQAYVQAANKMPDHVSADYGKGTDAAMGQLNWWIGDEAGMFYYPVLGSTTGEKSSAEDFSNPQFQEKEVKDRLDVVLDRVLEWRQHRVRCTLMSAAMGRCFALNLVRGLEGRPIITFVNSALNPGEPKWSEAGFIGAAIMLRGCAKSLPTDASQISEWMQKLEAFLSGDSFSFSVKTHAELLLRNLRSGPHDETSMQLFQLKDWLL